MAPEPEKLVFLSPKPHCSYIMVDALNDDLQNQLPLGVIVAEQTEGFYYNQDLTFKYIIDRLDYDYENQEPILKCLKLLADNAYELHPESAKFIHSLVRIPIDYFDTGYVLK
jgi:hypothetical protein